MLTFTLVLLDLSPAFTRLGTLPYSKAPRYFQQANGRKKVMTSAQLLVASLARHNNGTSLPSSHTYDVQDMDNGYHKEVSPHDIGLLLGDCSDDNDSSINQYQKQVMLPLNSNDSLITTDDTSDTMQSVMNVSGDSREHRVPDGSRRSIPCFKGSVDSNNNNKILSEYATATSPSTSYGSLNVINILRSFNADEDTKLKVHEEEERKWKLYKQHHEKKLQQVRRNSLGVDRRTGTQLPSVRKGGFIHNHYGEGKNISHHQFPFAPLPLQMEDHYHAMQIKKRLDTSGLLDSHGNDGPDVRLQPQQSISTSRGPRTALLCPEADEDYDEDIVMDEGHEQAIGITTAKSEDTEVNVSCSSQDGLAAHGNSSSYLTSNKHSKVSVDIVDMVTNEFAKERESEIRRRRKILYELMHPVPTHYTFNGKLIPPPPIAFGEVPEESRELGRKMMVNQNYRLVRTSPHTDYFFEINDLYIEIAMVGKANAGKSSLINALLGNDVAKTSSTPNSTRGVNFYQSVTPEELQRFVNRNPSRLVKLPAGGMQFTFVDLPGFGISGMSNKWRDNAIAVTDSYLGVRRSVNTIFMCIDATKGLTAIDRRYFNWIENIHGMFYIVLTKCESVSHDKLSRIIRNIYQVITDTNKGEKKYKAVYPYIIPVSAHTGENIDLLRGIIVETSGIVPGQKLRKMLRRKLEEANRLTEMEEIVRIEAARKIEQEIAKAEYEKKRSLELEEDSRVVPKSVTSFTPLLSIPTQALLPPMTFKSRCAPSQVTENPMKTMTPAVATSVSLSVERLENIKNNKELAGKGPVACLNFGGDNNNTNNYRDYIEKFHLGLMDLPESIELDREHVSDTSSKSAEAASGNLENLANLPISVRLSSTSSVIGIDNRTKFVKNPDEKPNGTERPISHYMSSLAKFAEEQENKDQVVPKWVEKKQQRWQQNMKSVRHSPLLVQDPTHPDILQAMKAGKATGPKLINRMLQAHGSKVKLTSKMDTLNAKNLTTYRLMKEALSVMPTAPWAASSQTCKSRQEELKNRFGIRMSKHEISQYMKYSGKTLQTFEEYDNEVTVKKFMNEKRVAKGTYQSCLARISDENRVSYGQQPVGMLKKYGRSKSYWRTTSVVGK